MSVRNEQADIIERSYRVEVKETERERGVGSVEVWSPAGRHRREMSERKVRESKANAKLDISAYNNALFVSL